MIRISNLIPKRYISISRTGFGFANIQPHSTNKTNGVVPQLQLQEHIPIQIRTIRSIYTNLNYPINPNPNQKSRSEHSKKYDHEYSDKMIG